MNWFVCAAAVFATILGTLAYRKIWLNWIRPVRPGQYGYSVGFGFLYFGISTLTVFSALGLDALGLSLLAKVIGAIGAAVFLVFAVSLFWLPKFLLPEWFKAIKSPPPEPPRVRSKQALQREAWIEAARADIDRALESHELRHFNWYEDRERHANEVGIARAGHKWRVYSTDENSHAVLEVSFTDEETAFVYFYRKLEERGLSTRNL